MKNNNGAIIKRLTLSSLKANKKRNLFIILAIALTTFLLGSVFSIGMSLVESQKMQDIRQAGTVGHGAVGHPSASQLEKLAALDYVDIIGTNNNVAYVKSIIPELKSTSLALHYLDKTDWEKLHAPAYTDITGDYPQKENEIMVSLGILNKMGITNPTLGMKIPLTYYTDSENRERLIDQEFILSGWYKSYSLVQSMGRADTLLVSKALSDKYGKTVEKDGSATLLFDDASRVMEYLERLKGDLSLGEDQPVVASSLYSMDEASMSAGIAAIAAIVAFLILTGYLLIYNVLFISVSRDVRFYGLLKTLGTTAKQIKRVVFGQTVRLCLIGIPLGAILALLISLLVVPFSINQLGAASTGAVVSFSPLIYAGAAFFALVTALLGAFKPAKKAGEISPVEAQKFTGVPSYADRSYKPSRGRISVMALRNLFRDKKRSLVVLLSLFLGITTFLTVTTLVSGMAMDHYVEAMYESDFVLGYRASLGAEGPSKKFDSAFIKKLEALPGLERIGFMTRGWMRLDYTPEAFGQYIADLEAQNKMVHLSEDEIDKSFRGFIAGIDRQVLISLNETLDKPLDLDAFERGEFGLIATDNDALFSSVKELSFAPLYWSEAGLKEDEGSEKLSLPLGGFVPFSFKDIGSGLAPTVFVSNAVINSFYADPLIWEVTIDVSDGYEQEVLSILKQLSGNDPEIVRTSKIEALQELNSAKMVLFILGGGIALIIALIGILNFVNVMSVGIMVRRNELTTLESVGMSRKQVRKLLVGEGLGYAVLTLFFVFTAGSLINFGVFALIRQQITYAVFAYPVIPMLLVSLAILAVCVITPEIAYRSINRATIAQRLREAE